MKPSPRAPLALFFAVTLSGQPITSRTIFPSDSRAFAQIEDEDLIQTVCPGHAEKEGKVECGKNCPSSSGLDGGQQFLDWSLRRVTRGHFLSAASDDAVISTNGCEPHGSNWGGSALLTRGAEKWRMLWYKPGVETSRCHKVQIPSGRDILVCLGEYDLQDNITTELYEEDLLNPQGSLMAGNSHILSVFDNTLACAYYDWTSTLKHTVLEKIGFTNALGEHRAISVTFSIGTRLMTPEAKDACTTQSQRRSSYMPRMRRYTLDFVFDGDNFEPTPSSAELEKRLGLK